MAIIYFGFDFDEMLQMCHDCMLSTFRLDSSTTTTTKAYGHFDRMYYHYQFVQSAKPRIR